MQDGGAVTIGGPYLPGCSGNEALHRPPMPVSINGTVPPHRDFPVVGQLPTNAEAKPQREVLSPAEREALFRRFLEWRKNKSDIILLVAAP